MARIPWHSRPRLLHNLLRHRAKRRNRRPAPRLLPRNRARILGVLGLVPRHHLARRARRLLVRNPKHERRECRARHARRHLALFSHAQKRDPGEPGYRYRDHD